MSLKTNLFRFIFISVLGVLLHFTYEWSGDNVVVGLFSAVNESTWEHLKLLFFPFLLLTILEVLLRGNMLRNSFSRQEFSVSSPEWAGLWSDFIRCGVCLAETTML